MDWILLVLLFGTACAPLVRAARPAAARAVLAAAAVVLFVVSAASLGSARREPPEPPADRPIAADTEGYVGSRACRSCHPAEHATWDASFHGTMTQVVDRTTVVPRFDELDLECFGEPLRLEWRGDELWAELIAGEQQRRRITRRVVQTTGSHHAQAYWYSTGFGRQLALLPLCYRIVEGQWMPVGAAFLRPPEYRDPPGTGAWNANCHTCHTTAGRPRLDADRVDTQVAEFGIACEACHGPGEDHVARNRDPLRRYGLHLGAGTDDTIVDPADLTPRRSAQVCGQCHSSSIVRLPYFDTWREEGAPYRPGQDLARTRLIVEPSLAGAPELRSELARNPHFFSSTFWPDGTVRVAGREYNGLLRSPCYAGGGHERSMTCLSCHRLHRDRAEQPDLDAWRDDQLAPAMRGDEGCTQCHPAYRDEAALEEHTHHAPSSSGSRCYNCHMSYTSYGLLKAIRSHTVESPSVGTELATGRPNACNQCHLDKSLGWTAERLDERYGIEPPELDDEQRTVAASIRWLLTGDAALRVLAAWSMGQEDALAASGTDWIEPYLGQLLADPYYAVRFVARRSLRALPAHVPPAGYDYLGDDAHCAAVARAVQERWQAALPATTPPRTALLLGSTGLDWGAFRLLLGRRDDRPVFLAE